MTTRARNLTRTCICPILIWSTDGWGAGPAYAEWHLMPDGRYRYSEKRKDTGDLQFNIAYQAARPTSRFAVPAHAGE